MQVYCSLMFNLFLLAWEFMTRIRNLKCFATLSSVSEPTGDAFFFPLPCNGVVFLWDCVTSCCSQSKHSHSLIRIVNKWTGELSQLLFLFQKVKSSYDSQSFFRHLSLFQVLSHQQSRITHTINANN